MCVVYSVKDYTFVSCNEYNAFYTVNGRPGR
jgi:hypothetical protein